MNSRDKRALKASARLAVIIISTGVTAIAAMLILLILWLTKGD